MSRAFLAHDLRVALGAVYGPDKKPSLTMTARDSGVRSGGVPDGSGPEGRVVGPVSGPFGKCV